MKQRVLTALALAPIALLACVVRTPYLLFGLCLLVTTLAFWELRSLLGQPKALPVVTLFGLAVPFVGTEIQLNRDPVQLILYAGVFWVLGLIFAAAAVYKGRTTAAGVDMAGLWISMPLTAMLMLHKLMPVHFTWTFGESFATYHCFPLLILLPLWGGDIAGLLVGSRFGKHRLAAGISPNKSWEGAIANFAACVAISLILIPVLGDSNRVILHGLCGATIGVVGQLGDLFESWMKRSGGVKDSGAILPGHGGVLDRIDSLLFTAPVVCLELVIAFR